MNCEKGDRECVYTFKSPRPQPSPVPPDPATISNSSSITSFDQPFSFRHSPSRTPTLPVPTTPSQLYPYHDIYSSSQGPQSFNTADPFGSQPSSAPNNSSNTPSPQIRQHPTTATALVRNSVLVNKVQSQTTLQRAI